MAETERGRWKLAIEEAPALLASSLLCFAAWSWNHCEWPSITHLILLFVESSTKHAGLHGYWVAGPVWCRTIVDTTKTPPRGWAVDGCDDPFRVPSPSHPPTHSHEKRRVGFFFVVPSGNLRYTHTKSTTSLLVTANRTSISTAATGPNGWSRPTGRPRAATYNAPVKQVAQRSM